MHAWEQTQDYRMASCGLAESSCSSFRPQDYLQDYVFFARAFFFVSDYRMGALKSQDDFRAFLFGVVMITMMVFTRSGFLHRSTHRQSREPFLFNSWLALGCTSAAIGEQRLGALQILRAHRNKRGVRDSGIAVCIAL